MIFGGNRLPCVSGRDVKEEIVTVEDQHDRLSLIISIIIFGGNRLPVSGRDVKEVIVTVEDQMTTVD